MKTFIVLFALVAMAASAAVREKRGYGHGWAGQSHGWVAPSHGWSQPQGWTSQSNGWNSGWNSGWQAQPKTKIIAVKKVVHVPREITVPQVVHVRKVISEPRVIVVKKEVPVQHGHHAHHGWW